MKNSIYVGMILLITGTFPSYAQTVGEPAPDFEVNLLEPDSAIFRLSSQEGNVVVVYLFGNGCPYCRASGPDIESSLYQAFKGYPEFTAIGVDTWNSSSNKASVANFRDITGITFPLAIKAGFVAKDYQTTYDRLMVIDKKGILVHKGAVPAGNDIANAVAVINQSLEITGIVLVNGDPVLNIYPNPVSEVLHIETRGHSISGISFYDVTGKQVYAEQFSEHTGLSGMEISLHQLEQGIYFYSIHSTGRVFTGKFLIRR